jgi:hypothetical protein
LAYFELSANESVDPGEILKHAQTAAAAGLAIDADELSEKTGYALRPVEREISNTKFQTPSNSQTLNSKIQNRGADADGLAARMERLLAADDEHFADELAALQAELPALLADADGAAVAAWEQLLGGELLAGLTGHAPIRNTTDDNGMEHDADDGKFTGKDGGAGGEKKSIREKIAAADELLTKGFTEKSADGKDVRFGARMKEHFDQDLGVADREWRKSHLDWGRETARSGTVTEGERGGKHYTYYAKKFQDTKKDRALLVIVDTADGEAFDFYPVPLKKAGERYGLKNRARMSRQLPPCFPRIMAAAGDAEGWLYDDTDHAKVNHKKTGGQK